MWWWVFLGVVGVLGFLLARTLAPSANKGGGSFDGFVGEDDGQERTRESKPDPYRRVWPGPGKQILILYGSEYGFTEQVARKLFDEILKLGSEMQPRLVSMANHEVVDFSQEQVLLVLCSTAGDGVPPTESRPFFDWIMKSDLDLSHARFTALALGDSAYPHFCRAGRTLSERLALLAGSPFVPSETVDLEDWTVINRWFAGILQALPVLPLQEKADYLDVESIGNDSLGPSRLRPHFGPLVERRDLTDSSSDKEVIHCEFDIRGSGLDYTSGDALGIYPLNNPPEVDSLLSALQRLGDTSIDIDLPSCYAPVPEGNKLPLKEALRKYFDLKVVTPDLVGFLAETATDQVEKDRGKALLAKGLSLKDNSDLRVYLHEREVADVLLDFGSSAATIPKVVSHLRTLQPRYYSISSSPKVGEGSSRVSVTVAIVRYETLQKPRTGVCSTFLSDRLKIGEDCALFISKNSQFRLPQSEATPIIMIGPGTGIAPFRAFLQERAASSTETKNLLYFGCRKRDTDFLYREELLHLEAAKKLTLRVAFSREQREKVYVQHLIQQDAALIWGLAQEGAHIYVCGDASQMARDVNEALLRIIESEGKMEAPQAEAFLANLEKEGRYEKDVWVT